MSHFTTYIINKALVNESAVVLINSNHHHHSMDTAVLGDCTPLMLLASSVFVICTVAFASPQKKGDAAAKNNITAGEQQLSDS